MAAAKKPTLSVDEGKAAAKALEVLFTTEYVSKAELYKANFLRGIFFSAGTIIGAALLVTLGLWILSFFDSIPFVNGIRESLESTQR
jgi:hypothetical protein